MSGISTNQNLPGALPRVLDEPLLGTKLIAPPTPDWLIVRPRLAYLLTRGTQRPVTLLAAPAGAGKTMLLSSWVRSGASPGPVIWLSLDPDDNDRARFWAYLLTGLRASGNLPARGLLSTLGPPTAGTAGAFLPAFVNGLAELAEPVVVVLDDVHELTAPPVLADIEYLIRHPTAQLRLVLAGRADPVLRLARLRVAGMASDVDASELAFSLDETAQLLGALGITLSDADVTALWARTEGWAAGLRLAALSLHNHPDPGGFVADFAGDDRDVADYLIGEVLDRQPASVRDFLLRTSITERLTGALADALTGGDDGIERLRELERANAFVLPLDRTRSTYRYHQLFAELLRAELRRQLPGEEAELHRRAARWHASEGAATEAVRHALAAEDWEYARTLLVERWASLWATPTVLWDLLARLPPDLVRHSPELAVSVVASAVCLPDLAAVEMYRPLAEASATALPEDRQGWFHWVMVQARMFQARVLGELDGLRAAAVELLELASAEEIRPQRLVNPADLRTVALSNLGYVAFWNGNFEAATLYLEEGLAASRRPLLPAEEYPRLNCLSYLALLAVAQGRLQLAQERGSQALALAQRHDWSHAMQAFGAHLALAWAAHHQGDLGGAARHLERAALAAHEPTAMAATAVVRSWLLASHDDPHGGLAVLRGWDIAMPYGTRWQPPRFLADLILLTEARLLLALGDTRAAHALLAQKKGTWSLPGVALVEARLLRAEGDPAAAAATLTGCLEVAGNRPANPLILSEARLLDAMIRDELGDHDQAAQSFERAVALAAAEHYWQPFIDGGTPVRALLGRHLERGIRHSAAVVQLLERTGHHVGDMHTPPAERLTEREQTVLRYMASLLRNHEIAAELYVSANTLKTHVRHINRKLGARGRRDAVDKARRLGLL